MIRNLILDLGGVILNIDYQRSIDAFEALGIPFADELYTQAAQSSLFEDLELGIITEAEFFDGMRKLAGKPFSDEEIRTAWNAILLDLPAENIEALKKLKSKYSLFLLSNTNQIHAKAYTESMIKTYGSYVFDDLFEKIYFSHILHLRKPDPEIFEYVLKDSNLNREETVFVDDSLQHVQSAEKIGIKSVLFQNMKLGEMEF